MSELPILDFIAASKARDAGIALAAANAPTFIQLALGCISRMEPGLEVQGEDLRVHLIERGIEPLKPQAWGAMTKAAIKAGYLIPTGIFKPTKSVLTHAHKTELYRTAGRVG